ncbi:DedA family protein [uncultured Helicobacter sp.]|uniref:DedA family protein n=1 Tax=uncultured Helicobacter sp. TaxID=175537 RepID=UPI0025832DF3|nr:DedA family protein [uncultured Helicobacter sp.]
MNAMVETFRDSFETWGYVILFLYCMGSGYVGIVAAGVLSALGSMNIGLSIVVAAMGNFVGSLLLVYLVRYQKKDFLKYLNKHRRKIALMHIWLKKYGSILILINKYLYGIKFLVPAAIGVSRYNIKRFMVLNFIACFVWAASLGIVAFYSSKFIEIFIDKYGQYSYMVVFGVFVVIIGFVVWLNQVAKPK